jgi:signal transduction histidine kinase
MLRRLRHPRTTVRWRLTLLYGGLFLASGAALLAITYTLVAHAPVRPVPDLFPRPSQFAVNAVRTRHVRVPPAAIQRTLPPQVRKALRTRAGRAVVVSVGSHQRISDLHQIIEESGIALGIMALISALLGWLVAGRVLRPLRTMTATTQQISEANLHERLAMQGPKDELRQLADTIDGLLQRLEGAFDAQRRFVANASHELRTPLTAARALLEMVLSDPHATVETFRRACLQVLEESEQQEQLIDALLALAQGQRGIAKLEAIDLAAAANRALKSYELEAATRGLRIETSLDFAPVAGDSRLAERLVSNLVENAVRHNLPDGRVEIETLARENEATLRVANDGPPVPESEIERLLQPFQRMAQDRIGHRDGLGLGLSIVAAIATAHDAILDIRPRQTGGLEVEIRFPLSPSVKPSEPSAVAAAGVGGP